MKNKEIIDPKAWISVGGDENDVNAMPWEKMHQTEHLLRKTNSNLKKNARDITNTTGQFMDNEGSNYKKVRLNHPPFQNGHNNMVQV